jgi:hypothetical protein
MPARGLGAFSGAWGMVTGFALFIVVEEYIATWWLPVGAVILATIAAAVVEWLRSLAEGHDVGRPTLSRALSFFVLLIVFEVFIYAFHDLMKDSDVWAHTADDLFGAVSFRGILNLVVFLSLWLILAAALGGALGNAVALMPHLKSREELTAELGADTAASVESAHQRAITRESLWIGLKAGLKIGLLTIPLIVLGYAVLIRLGWATLDMWFGSGQWSLPDGEDWFTYLAALMIFAAIFSAVSESNKGGAGFLVAYFGLHAYTWYTGDTSHTLTGFVGQLWRTVLLAVSVASLWAAPAVVMGVLAPFLRRPSQYPWLWAPLALGAAAGAVVVLLLQREPALYYVVPVVLVAMAVLIRVGVASIDELWPLMAASVATIIALATAVVLNLTPLAMYRSIDAVVIPPSLGSTERGYLAPRMVLIEEKTCPMERMAAYDELLTWIDELRVPPPFSLPDTVAMREVVEESRDLERAVFAGALNTPCDGSPGNEARPVTRATTFTLATVSALGFWLTLGLLAVWHVRRARAGKGAGHA